jgi:hypothetical protein
MVFRSREEPIILNSIAPGDLDQVFIKSTILLLGCTKACLLYEVVKHGDRQKPLIFGSRIFLAIAVSISPYQVNKRKAAVKLISIKSRDYIKTKKEIRGLYKNVLRYFMYDDDQESQWNLEKLGLHLEVYFDRKAQAELYIHLTRVEELPKDMPIFHSHGDFV